MPIVQLPSGKYRYGKTGKVYTNREQARKQGIAIELSKLRQEGRLEEKHGEIKVRPSTRSRAHIRRT